MRELTDAERVRELMRRLGRESGGPGRVYLTGGATAVLFGWRSTTIDVDLKLEGEAESLLRAIARLKDELRINVELASPADFIPELPEWRERSQFIEQHGQLGFYHYDLYSQALAKIERGHILDRQDVAAMLDRALIAPERVKDLFEGIFPELYRYPAIDPDAFRTRVDEALRKRS
jgi:hypothetical protein